MSDESVSTDSTDSTDRSTGRADSPTAGALDVERVRHYLNYALLGGLALLAAVAGVQFYLHAGEAITRWIAPAYRSLFQAAFNLAVLLVATAGVLRQLDRLSEE